MITFPRLPSAYPWGPPQNNSGRELATVGTALGQMFQNMQQSAEKQQDDSVLARLSQADSADEVRSQLASLDATRANSSWLSKILTPNMGRGEQAVRSSMVGQIAGQYPGEQEDRRLRTQARQENLAGGREQRTRANKRFEQEQEDRPAAQEAARLRREKLTADIVNAKNPSVTKTREFTNLRAAFDTINKQLENMGLTDERISVLTQQQEQIAEKMTAMLGLKDVTPEPETTWNLTPEQRAWYDKKKAAGEGQEAEGYLRGLGLIPAASETPGPGDYSRKGMYPQRY